MRKLEIILKLVFLAGSINFYITKAFDSIGFTVYLIAGILLGLILIINKDSSYHYPQKPQDYVIRRVEGALLIIFSIIALIYA